MNAESNKIRQSLVDQLSSFEERLDDKLDDVRLLADIQDGIGNLIGASGGNEAEIRRVLQERYESGNLRKETFQLVKSMLDRFVSEQVPTAGAVTPKAPERPEPPIAPAYADSHVQTIAEAASELSNTELTRMAKSGSTDIPAAEAADKRVQVGTVLRDRFMLQTRIAGGSMGVVYKALDRRLAEADSNAPFVAVKVLSPHLASNAHALRALQQEAAKGRCLTHQNIVRFIDLDRDEDLYFIVMEWLEGRTLADILDAPETGKVETQRAFQIVAQLANALSYAHRCGIVHADVKPGNVMIMPNGDAKLLDFGVARVRQKQLETQKNFDPGVLGLVTPAYASMQVLTGEDPTPADDVFSLACLMYRLLAGYRVFGPRNAAEAAEEGMKPQCPQGLDEARWKVLKKALSYSRITRYETMDEFIAALNPKSVGPVDLVVPPRDDFDVHEDAYGPGRWIAGLIVLLGLLGGAAYQFGYLDELKERFLPDEPEFVQLPPAEEPEIAVIAEPVAEPVAELPADVQVEDEPVAEEITELPEDDLDEVAVAALEYAGSGADQEATSDEAGSEVLSEPVESDIVSPPPLPAATAELNIDVSRRRANSARITLREDGDSATVDIIRADASLPLRLRIEEAGFSGNRSPWISGQFTISGDGYIEFEAGQSRARVTLEMTSDPLREADQQSTLRVRDADTATSELGTITVNLEDDDQRAFEATMPANTVAFATTQMTVRERDPAVQIDILRFNPDNTRLEIHYRLRDITATKGEDYFEPRNDTIEFRPGQRNARLLIPLVKDGAFESNEAFKVELMRVNEEGIAEVYAETAVIIRDDDS
ncbi:MAG: protein kinase domain-containing protein [Woeseiaceae bacterium]